MRDPLTLRYLESLRGRAADLRRIREGVARGELEALESLGRIAHVLKGSGGSFGFPEITEVARRFEAIEQGDRLSFLDDLLALLDRIAPPVEEEGGKIMVVEGDPELGHLLEVMLGGNGRSVVRVKEGGDVVERAVGARPDLLVLDLVLPDGDGRKVLMRLQERPATAEIPVVTIAPAQARALRSEALALGADLAISKPFDAEEVRALLLARLGVSLRSRKVASPGTTAASTHEQRAAPPIQDSETSEPLPFTGAPVVALVEDDPLTVELVRHRLERGGYTVRHHADGRAAFEALKSDPPALAILDVKLPGMDGFELLDRLRRIPAWSQVPILMLTGMGSESDVVRGFHLGANDYVVKPFSPNEFLARIERFLPALRG